MDRGVPHLIASQRHTVVVELSPAGNSAHGKKLLIMEALATQPSPSDFGLAAVDPFAHSNGDKCPDWSWPPLGQH